MPLMYSKFPKVEESIPVKFNAVYYIHGMGDTISSVASKVERFNKELPQEVIPLEYNYPNVSYDYATMMGHIDTGNITENDLIIGSSWGGYLAAQLASRYRCRCILGCPVTDATQTASLFDQTYNPWRWYYDGTNYGTTTQATLNNFASLQYDPRVSLPSERIAVITALNDTLISPNSVLSYYESYAGYVFVSDSIGHVNFTEPYATEYMEYVKTCYRMM